MKENGQKFSSKFFNGLVQFFLSGNKFGVFDRQIWAQTFFFLLQNVSAEKVLKTERDQPEFYNYIFTTLNPSCPSVIKNYVRN
jgi:hypothetical protein